jgi:FKBP-type peptidyl-prolyl cis-trans isomerase SlyD
MIVEEQNIITIAYELREGNAAGPLLERMDHNYTFKFYFGSGKLLPAFEDQLYGLEEGKPFQFTLTPEQGYGRVEEGNIIDVPRSVFAQIGENVLVAGNFVSLKDDEGIDHNGKIISWNDEHVKVDFNHAMAGKELHFSGVILNIREATVDEHIRKSYIEEDGMRGREIL